MDVHLSYRLFQGTYKTNGHNLSTLSNQNGAIFLSCVEMKLSLDPELSKKGALLSVYIDGKNVFKDWSLFRLSSFYVLVKNINRCLKKHDIEIKIYSLSGKLILDQKNYFLDHLSKIKDDKTCTICLEEVDHQMERIFPCGHLLHLKCFFVHYDYTKKNMCPICQKVLPKHI